MMPQSDVVQVQDEFDRWDKIRLEYLHENLEAARKEGVPQVTLKLMSERYGINYGTLRNKAAEEDWNGQLTIMIESQKASVSDRVLTLSFQSELEIRTRQVKFGKKLQSIGMLRIVDMTAEEIAKLTVKDCLTMVELGSVMERKAAGMDDKFTPPPVSTIKDTQTQEAVRQATAALQRFRDRLRLINRDVPTPT